MGVEKEDSDSKDGDCSVEVLIAIELKHEADCNIEGGLGELVLGEGEDGCK